MVKDKILETFSHHRALFYALSLGTGFVILLTLRDLAVKPLIFWIFSAILYLIIVIEVNTTYAFAIKKAKRLELPHLAHLTIKPHFYYHVFVASILYFSSIVFIFFQFNEIIEIVSIAAISGTYYAVLRHLRATFERDFKTEIWSEYILDASIIVIFFYCMSAIIEVSARFSLNYFLPAASATIISGVFLSLTIWKKLKFEMLSILYTTIISITIGVIAYTTYLTFSENTSIARAILWTIAYYILSAIYYHRLEGTLNFGILIEYVLIAAVAVFLYMSIL